MVTRHSCRTVSPPTPESKTPTGRESTGVILEREYACLVGRRVLVLLCALALVPLAGGSSTRAAATYTSVDETIHGAGVSLAATLYTPSGTEPAGGWPA